MTFNILVFILILFLVSKLISQERSWQTLLIMMLGLIVMLVNLSSIIDFSLTYAIMINLGMIIQTAYRLYIVAAGGQGIRSYDDDL